MLVAASVVFLYYSIWTLLMVRTTSAISRLCQMLTSQSTALRRLRSPSTEHLPSSSVGYPHPSYPYSLSLRGGRLVSQRGYDSKQQEESSQGKGSWKEEGVM